MENRESIPGIMKKHHYQLEGLFNRFKKHQNEFEVFPNNFNKFKWELKKHFLLEEKAIFTLIYKDDLETHEMKNTLLNEHRNILQKLEKIEDGLKKKNNIELDNFQELLVNHRNFEDEKFYPKLDEELEESKKKEIIDRISTPV